MCNMQTIIYLSGEINIVVCSLFGNFQPPVILPGGLENPNQAVGLGFTKSLPATVMNNSLKQYKSMF